MNIMLWRVWLPYLILSFIFGLSMDESNNDYFNNTPKAKTAV